MTGFGRGQSEQDGVRITAILQGVNHRHADLQLRLPELLKPLEPRLRSRLSGVFKRGRCDLSVRVDGTATQPGRAFDRSGFERFIAETRELVDADAVSSGLSLGDLLRSPLMVPTVGSEVDLAAIEPLVDSALAEAVGQFQTSRRTEGERLGSVLAAGTNRLAELVEQLAGRRVRAAGALESDLRRRLDQILPGGAQSVAPERLAQEIILCVERSDVAEELDRLRGHLVAVREALAEDAAQGRRLDFLAQEIHRELNTLGAKARDLELTQLVVEAKVNAEQLREQIQNVE